MKRIFITGLALMGFFRLSAQTEADSTQYKSQKLKIEEMNLVSSYYNQEGNNSAVTGGIGTEKLNDLSNFIDLNMVRHTRSGKKQTYDFELGVDHYSSASSDKIDLSANSSASSSDMRIYPSINFTQQNEEKGNTFGAGVSSSTEYDYQSFGGNIMYAKQTADKNGEFTAKFNAYLDQVKLITPTELRASLDNGTASRNTFAGSLSYSQVVNQNLQVLIQADIVSQQGYLGLPFHRVYFQDGSVNQEKLPDSRLKFPIAARASYFLGDNIIIRAYYRYYTDDWKLTSHTADLEIPVKITPFFSISPFYRYYSQSATKYFDVYGAHTASNDFYTSNYDLSKFTSNFYGVGVKLTPVRGLFGIQHLNTLEIRYGHYDRSTNLTSNIISINIKYK